MSSTNVDAAGRGTQHRGDVTRRAILDAALVEFAAAGFDAASTRAIASRAGVRQGQLTYHFAAKELLWRATVDHLFVRFDGLLTDAAANDHRASIASPDAASRLARSIRALVHAAARLPELHRIMVQEATAFSPRLEWIVEHHVRSRFVTIAEQWTAVRRERSTHLVADPIVIYYTVVGAASLLYVNAPEAELLLDRVDIVDDDLITDHADLIVAMLLGPNGPAPAPAEPLKGH